jgi:hypothetical protein
MAEFLATPDRAYDKLDRPEQFISKAKRREPPLKVFKLFFKTFLGKPNFSAFKVIVPKVNKSVPS